MRWQTFLPNFWKITSIKAVAFSCILPFERNFLKERKDDVADKVSPQTRTTAVLRCELITHELWVFSSWNKQRWNKNILRWCNQTLSGRCSSDMVPMWLAGNVFFTAEKDVFWHDHQIPLSALTVSYECIVEPIFFWRKLIKLNLFGTYTVCSKVKKNFLADFIDLRTWKATRFKRWFMQSAQVVWRTAFINKDSTP
jgi:hypothetical protein